MICKMPNCDRKASCRKRCRSHYDRWYRKTHAKEDRVRVQRWRSEHSDRVQDSNLKYQYGITQSDKVRMYESQFGLCGLCGKPLPAHVGACCVDHNHGTMQIRSLVHRRCNIAIGYIEKTPELVVQVPDYLRRYCMA